MRQVIEPLLRELISIHSKVDRAIILNAENLAAESLNEDEQTNSALLESLRFSNMTHRRAEIAEAHQKTFFWLLREEQPREDIARTRPWNSFVQWLRDGGDIYWINGKAGSGKSTLMR
jgi:hypothetical protein